MEYNDYAILSDQDYVTLQKHFEKIRTNEKNDLEEILHKLEDQHKVFNSFSPADTYNDIKVKIANDIELLKNIIYGKSNYIKNLSLKPEIPAPPNEFKNSFFINNLPINNKNTNKTYTHRQNSNTNLFANLLQKLNFSRLKNTTNNHSLPQAQTHTNRKYEYYSDYDYKKHKNTEPHDCSPLEKVCIQQLDIIRLILLYITLRPNCPYIHSLSTIAVDQLDIYLKIKDK